MVPQSILQLIQEFSRFPGIGPKTAERFVFYLLKSPENDLQSLANAILQLKKNIVACNQCHQYSLSATCSICSDQKRDATKLCIVAQSQDIPILEKTGTYNGHYHVLGGVLNQIENVSPKDLHLDSLVTRIKNSSSLQEIILATNPDLEGETTALYIRDLLKPFTLKITRLARGLPMGADIGYADEITLKSAIQGRREI